MEYACYRITLDVQAAGSGIVISAKQGDTGRKLCVSLTDGGRPYPLEADCLGIFTARKPDGHILFQECTLEGNVICYPFHPQLLAVAGLVKCEVQIYGKNAMLLTSASFDLLVEEAVYAQGDEIQSEDDFSALAQLISQNQALHAELLKLQQKLEALAGGVVFVPEVDGEGLLSWKNNGQLPNPEPVNLRGSKGADGATAEEVLEAMPKLTGLDLSDFENGSFAEIIDGVAYPHAVSFDAEGRPVKIDGIDITWGAG